MPRRRTRIAALENAAREVMGLPTQRPTQWVTGAGGIASAEAFGGTVVIGGTAIEHDVALPGTLRRVRIERRGIRVMLTARRRVIVPARELCVLAGGIVGGFGNPVDSRGGAIGVLIGFAVGWWWEAYGPGPD
jgi:hypothetical protein